MCGCEGVLYCVVVNSLKAPLVNNNMYTQHNNNNGIYINSNTFKTLFTSYFTSYISSKQTKNQKIMCIP